MQIAMVKHVFVVDVLQLVLHQHQRQHQFQPMVGLLLTKQRLTKQHLINQLQLLVQPNSFVQVILVKQAVLQLQIVPLVMGVERSVKTARKKYVCLLVGSMQIVHLRCIVIVACVHQLALLTLTAIRVKHAKRDDVQKIAKVM